MTMKYVHIGMDDQAKALKSLPAPSESWQDIGRKPGVFDGQKRSAAGTKSRNAQRAKKSKSPVKNGASGGSEQSVSASDTDAPIVEAAGIEPASRDGSTMMSTCVVELFVFQRTCRLPRRCPTGSAAR